MTARDSDGSGVLSWATKPGNAETVRMLLNHGAEVAARDARGNTALIGAAWNYEISDVLALLLDAGADINAQNHAGETALMEAADSGAVDTIEFLLKNGADPNPSRQSREDRADARGDVRRC